MPSLTWLNDDEARKTSAHIPYRLLEADAGLSHGAADTGNMLIQGDNLEALKALLPYYAGQVKCIYIDPPYNTQSAFEHYDDNLEHATWLSMMYPRLELLRDLLSEDGSIWVSIDDNEGHYLKVMMDEVFGRGNFVANVVWEKSDSPRMDAHFFSSRHDHLLVFAKNMDIFVLGKIPSVDGEIAQHYNKIDENERRYYTKPLRAMGGQGDSRVARPNLYYPIVAPDGSFIYPIKQDGSDGAWRWSKEKVESEISRIEWVKGRKGWTPYFRIYGDNQTLRPAETIWYHNEVGSNRTSKAEIKHLFSDLNPFDTPKPEKLLKRILDICTIPGDIILDSFLGSGTTISVAHKMKRRYIGIEIGDNALVFCVPRLQKVIEGEQGGISKEVNWLGGGGFRFYRLGETVFDEFGNINPAVRFKELAAHVWFVETKTPLLYQSGTALLGIHHETACYLLYNGILGDKRPEAGNVLTSRVLEGLPPHTGPRVIYGEYSTLDEATLREMNISFKHIPYDIKAR